MTSQPPGPGPSGTHMGNGLEETARADHNLEASGNAHAGVQPSETAFQTVGTGWHSRCIAAHQALLAVQGTSQERAVGPDIVDSHHLHAPSRQPKLDSVAPLPRISYTFIRSTLQNVNLQSWTYPSERPRAGSEPAALRPGW